VVQVYPEKPIYDIPAWPVISGQELTDRLMEQIAPFDPTFHFSQMASEIKKLDNGNWELKTDAETVLVDWALNLQPLVKSLTLVHRRDDFRAAPDSVRKMRELVADGKMNLVIGNINEVTGEGTQISSLNVKTKDQGDIILDCSRFLAFYGLTMKLGPVAEFGLNLHENLIPVDTEKFQTSEAGIFAVGDINYYPGKLKLILSGFHEAALMAQEAFRIIHPDKKLRFQYTTSSSDLQKKLGVKDEKAA